MTFNEESQRLWSSRASFGIALIALLGTIHGGCRDRSEPETLPSAEPSPSNPNPNGAVVTPEPERAALPPSAASPAADPAVEPSPAPQAPPSPIADRKSEPTDPTSLAQHPLVIKRLVVTHEVKDREPVAAETLVAGSTPVFAFVELENPGGEDQKIVITFEHESNKRVGFVELTVPKEQKRWRTWGQTKNIQSPGSWTAIVTTPTGTELGRETFEVAPTVASNG